MLTRLFWLAFGVALGVTLAVLVARRVRRYRPDAMAADAAENLRRFGQDLREAVKEGRAAMVETEAAIRAELGERPAPAAADATPS